MATDYQAGVSAERLTMRYGLSKGTVLKHLAEQGVLRPQHRLTPAMKREAISLYAAGMSLAQVSTQLSYRPEAVRRALDEAGVPRRDRYGHQRQKPEQAT